MVDEQEYPNDLKFFSYFLIQDQNKSKNYGYRFLGVMVDLFNLLCQVDINILLKFIVTQELTKLVTIEAGNYSYILSTKTQGNHIRW